MHWPVTGSKEVSIAIVILVLFGSIVYGGYSAIQDAKKRTETNSQPQPGVPILVIEPTTRVPNFTEVYVMHSGGHIIWVARSINGVSVSSQ